MRAHPVIASSAARAAYGLAACLILAISLVPPQPLSAQRPDSRAVRRAQEMVRARADAGRVAAEMTRSYRQTPTQVSAILRTVSFSAAQSAPALVSTIRVPRRDAAEHMVRGGYAANETTRALLRASVPAADVVAGLRSAGVDPPEVAGSLRSARLGGTAATRALKGAGLGGEEAAAALLGGGYEPIDIRDALDAEFTTVAVPFLARAMAFNGDAVGEVATAMATRSRSFAEALSILVQVGYGPVESGAALLDESVYGAVPVSEVAQALSAGQGTPDSELLSTVQSVLDASKARVPLNPVPAAELQRGVGVSAVTAFRALGQVFGLPGIEVFRVARDAGYPPEELAEGAVQAFDLLLEDVAEALVADDADAEELVITVLEAERRGGRSSVAQGVGRAIGTVFRAAFSLVGSVAEVAMPIVEVFIGEGVPIPDVVGGMLGAGPSFRDVLAAFPAPELVLPELLQGAREVDVTPQDVVAALSAASIPGANAAPALRDAWQLGEETVATYMGNAGYSAGQVALGLDAMGESSSDIVRILQNQGTSLEEITRVLGRDLELANQALAQALHDARVSHAQILRMLTEVQRMQHEAAMLVIEGIRG